MEKIHPMLQIFFFGLLVVASRTCCQPLKLVSAVSPRLYGVAFACTYPVFMDICLSYFSAYYTVDSNSTLEECIVQSRVLYPLYYSTDDTVCTGTKDPTRGRGSGKERVFRRGLTTIKEKLLLYHTLY